jgi:predicted nucleic acid-binding protein
MLINALKETKFKDFEDCIQAECAKTVNADFIVTRNAKDFIYSETKAITPKEFLLNFN